MRTQARAALGAAANPATWGAIAHDTAMAAQVGAVVRAAGAARAALVAEIPPERYLDYARTGDRGAFEALYFERRRRLVALALDALLHPGVGTGDLAEAIETICDEPQWALPAHVGGDRDPAPARVSLDLFATETGSALSEVTALLESRLPAPLVERVRAEVLARVIEPYERYRFWWEDSPNNWAAVCAGSVALAALQVCEPERVLALAPRLRASLRRSLDGYGEDGVCVEGFGYWRYGFGYYLVATEALDAALGPDPAGEPARAGAAARWPLRAFLSGDVLVSFADTWLRGRLDAGLLAGAQGRYGQVGSPSAALVDPEVIDDCGRWALALRSLVWQHGADAGVPADHDRPRWYPDAQWLVVPQGAHSSLGLAVRGGHNGEPHNHDDLGSLIAARDGEILLADAGRGVYDAAYFGPDRYDNPAAGSQGHGVPLLDGVRQAHGEQARAEVLTVEIGPGGERFVVDLTGAYDHPDLVRLVRTVERRGDVVTVTDAMEARAPIALTQRFVTLLPPEVVDGEVLLVGERARAALAVPGGASIETGAFAVGRGSFPIEVHHVDVVHRAGSTVEATCVLRAADL